MKTPKVSVIVPNYNHARYLETRIQSVLDQTYDDFEVIYLDDASKDNSDEIFACFAADPRIRSVLNSQNSGTPFKQWNKGVREARGEYIWLAEADDRADPQLLQALVALLDANADVDIAYCSSLLVDRNDRIIGTLPAIPEFELSETAKNPASAPRWDTWNELPWAQDFMADGPLFYRHYMIYENLIPNASAVVFRKSAYEAAGGAPENLRVCGDYIAWIEMLKRGNIAFCARPLNYFRMHGQSARSSGNKSGIFALERFQVARAIMDDLPLEPGEIDHLCHIRMGHWLDDFFSPTRRLSREHGLKLFHLARRSDPRFWPRLVWQSGFFLLERAPFFDVLRDFARRFVWRMRTPTAAPRAGESRP